MVQAVPLVEGTCRWCSASLVHARRDAIYCTVQCRKRAFRFRRLFPAGVPPAARPGLVFVYADPPYIDKAWYYEGHPDFGGEVDHVELIAGLERRRLAGEIHGWALSCSKRSLRVLLPLCPLEADWAPWVKPTPILPSTAGPQNRTECVIWIGGRPCMPGVADALVHVPARDQTSDLVGRKPPAFAAWLFQLLGLVPGDELEDMFPGTGQVGRAWQEICLRTVPFRSRTPSRVDAGRVPQGLRPPSDVSDVSRAAAARVSPRVGTRPLAPWDASRLPGGRHASLFPRGRVPDVAGTDPAPRPAAPEAPAGADAAGLLPQLPLTRQGGHGAAEQP